MTKEMIINSIKEKKITKAYILGYFYDKVCVGIYENEDIIFNRQVNYDLLTQIRIFNKDLEIKYVLDEEKQEFIYSEVIEDLEKDHFDEYMYVSGNKILFSNDKFTTITQIGREVDIPFKVTSDEVEKGIRLVVRNYFEENEDKQVVLTNSRLVGFSKEEGELYE